MINKFKSLTIKKFISIFIKRNLVFERFFTLILKIIKHILNELQCLYFSIVKNYVNIYYTNHHVVLLIMAIIYNIILRASATYCEWYNPASWLVSDPIEDTVPGVVVVEYPNLITAMADLLITEPPVNARADGPIEEYPLVITRVAELLQPYEISSFECSDSNNKGDIVSTPENELQTNTHSRPNENEKYQETSDPSLVTHSESDFPSQELKTSSDSHIVNIDSFFENYLHYLAETNSKVRDIIITNTAAYVQANLGNSSSHINEIIQGLNDLHLTTKRETVARTFLIDSLHKYDLTIQILTKDRNYANTI